ncbi:hypothetical protein N7490_005454 [Penicillium lividum]|nr:hypothetical protein N7490_005454 [Penicillium lividum]
MENMRAKVQQAQRLAGHDSSRDLVAAKIHKGPIGLAPFPAVESCKHTQRRFTRPGYGSEARSGGFWKTEDYFEKMVWRNYVAQHAQFFIGGDVEGIVHAQQCQNLGIAILPGLDRPLEDSLPWAIDQII